MMPQNFEAGVTRIRLAATRHDFVLRSMVSGMMRRVKLGARTKTTPNDHTSDADEKRRYCNDSGDIHLTGSGFDSADDVRMVREDVRILQENQSKL